jgi:hypothetical protein
MRLTQLAGTDLVLDLYVISDDFVEVSGMKTILADRYANGPEGGLQGLTYRLRFGFPALTNLMGNKGTITRLRGVLKNQELDHDFVIAPSRQGPVYTKLYAKSAAVAVAIQWALVCAGLLMVPGAFCAYLRPGIFRNRNPRFVVAIAGLLVGTVIFPVVRAITPQTQVTKNIDPNKIRWIAGEFANDEKSVPKNGTKEEIERAFLDYVKERGYRIQYSDVPFQMEESPGSAVLIQQPDGQYILRAFSEGYGCYPWDYFIRR